MRKTSVGRRESCRPVRLGPVIGAVAAAVVFMALAVSSCSGVAQPSSATWSLKADAAQLSAPTLTSPLTLWSPNAQLSGNFAWSVAVSGRTVVVGAPRESTVTPPGTCDQGRAYAFAFNGKWGYRTVTLPNPYPSACARFGWSVAISGTTAVVGAYEEPVGTYTDAGEVFIFNTATGALVRALTSLHPAITGDFGASVAISGSTVVVGAPGEVVMTSAGPVLGGHVYVYSVSGTLISMLTSPAPVNCACFGTSVAISGRTVVVGQTTSVGGPWGSVYVYKLPTTGVPVSTLTSPILSNYNQFGSAVAIIGSKIVVGARGETVSGFTDAGNAYVFVAPTGRLLFTLTSRTPQTNGGFGSSVAITGSSVVVGAPGEMASGLPGAGNAYLFRTTTGAWISTLTTRNANTNGWFGYSVGISGTTIVVGAPVEVAPPPPSTAGSNGAGNAYVF